MHKTTKHHNSSNVPPHTPKAPNTRKSQQPTITGQCAKVLHYIKQGPVLSFILTADYAIPQAAARIHELRAMGYNIITTILAEVRFRNQTRRKVALYSMGSPEWSPQLIKKKIYKK